MGEDIYGEGTGDQLGSSVSLSADGKTVAIGAYVGKKNYVKSGYVKVFSFNEKDWVKVGNDIIGEAHNDLFGISLSLSNDGKIVAIGAVYNDGVTTNTGKVKVYSLDGTSWVPFGDDIVGTAYGEQIGRSVSLSANANGTTVAVGAHMGDGNNFIESGHVRVYYNVSNSWKKRGEDIAGELAGDRSGASVSLSANGTIVAIGAPHNEGNGKDSGHVRVHSFDGESWSKMGQDIEGEENGDLSGWLQSISLSSDGTIVAIGAVSNDGNGSDSGHVRVYSYDDNYWTKLGTDIDGDASGDSSGFSVSLSSDGSTVAIGSPKNDKNGVSSGHVRIYSFVNNSWVNLGQHINGESSFLLLCQLG
jgi:hypothetical protein